MTSKRAQSVAMVAALTVAIAVIVMLGRLMSGTYVPSVEPLVLRNELELGASARTPLAHDDPRGSVSREDSIDAAPTTTEVKRSAATTVAPQYEAITVEGYVINATSYKPIEGATIASDAEPLASKPRVLAHTNSKGDFVIENVAPGRLALRISAPGYLDAEQQTHISSDKPTTRMWEVRLVSDRSVTIRFVGPDGRPFGEWCRKNVERGKGVDISVYESEEPLPKRVAAGAATRAGGIGESLYLRPDWRSETQVPVNLPYPLYLSACSFADPRDFDRVQVIASVRVDSAGLPVQFTIPAEVFSPPLSRVHVCAVDAITGAPITDARVGLNPRGTFGNAVQTTSADGCARFENIRSGRHSLTIVAKGHEWIQEEVVVADADVDLGVVRMSPSTRLSGHVFDESGAVSGVNVFAYPLEKFDRTRAIRSSFGAATKPDGSFEVQSIGRGSYLVRAQGAGWASIPQVVDTTAGDVSDVVVHVSRGAELRIVVDEPLPDATLCIATTGKLPVAELVLAGVRELTQRLVPGEYEWRIDLDDRHGDGHRFALGDRELTIHVSSRR